MEVVSGVCACLVCVKRECLRALQINILNKIAIASARVTHRREISPQDFCVLLTHCERGPVFAFEFFVCCLSDRARVSCVTTLTLTADEGGGGGRSGRAAPAMLLLRVLGAGSQQLCC